MGTDLYIFGGYNLSTYKGLNTILKFDTTTETLITLETTLPQKLLNISSGIIDNNIYLFGGRLSTGYEVNTILKFDITTETLTTLEITLPSAAYKFACCEEKNNIYLLGGGTNTILKFTS